MDRLSLVFARKTPKTRHSLADKCYKPKQQTEYKLNADTKHYYFTTTVQLK